MEDFILNTLDGIAQVNFNIVGTLLALVLIVFWLVVLSWIWVDSGERVTNKWIRIFYTFIGLIPVFGWIIYLIIRPSETIEEIYWGDLERRYLIFETAELGDCPNCSTQLFPGYVFCPKCKFQLKFKCNSCGIYVDRNHKFCTNCGNQMKDRAVKEDVPTTEIMEEKNASVKEEVKQNIKEGKSKYKVSTEFVGRIGGSIIEGYKIIGNKVSDLFSKKEAENIQEVEVKQNLEKKGKKKKKKKKKNKKNKK